METIIIRLQGRTWYAQHSDPAVFDLFGTDTLPTPWLLPTPGDTVRAEIARLNPTARVILED